ncbi:MAG: DNA-binding protein [Rhodobacteraceae bacterium]|nr:MAG: DNA-binding protein [Paracoccaceae bacterium]
MQIKGPNRGDEAPILVPDKHGAAMFNWSRATFWRRVKDGTLPRPIKIAGATRWRRDELLETIERLTAERDAE